MTTATTPLPGSSAPTDGGWGRADAPAVPVQTRSERPWSYAPADFGAPTGREVNWKPTPLYSPGGFLAPAVGPSSVRVDLGHAQLGRAAGRARRWPYV